MMVSMSFQIDTKHIIVGLHVVEIERAGKLLEWRGFTCRVLQGREIAATNLTAGAAEYWPADR
jgi:hypothetical protein